MANVLYDKGREGFLDGSIDWDTDDIRVVLVKSAYAFSAAHDFMDDIGSSDKDIPVRVVPSRYLMSPPKLARDGPVF